MKPVSPELSKLSSELMAASRPASVRLNSPEDLRFESSRPWLHAASSPQERPALRHVCERNVVGVPFPLGGDLRQQQTAPPSHLHHQAMAPNLDVRGSCYRLERAEHRDLDLDLRQLRRRHRRKPWIGAARGDGTLRHSARQRIVALDVADASAELAAMVNGDEHAVAPLVEPGRVAGMAGAPPGYMSRDGIPSDAQQRRTLGCGSSSSRSSRMPPPDSRRRPTCLRRRHRNPRTAESRRRVPQAPAPRA